MDSIKLNRHFFLAISIIWIGLFISCGQKNQYAKKAKAVKSLTLIKLGVADSANNLNKGLGVHSYTYINLSNDSVSSYFKSKPSLSSELKVVQTSGFIEGIGSKDTVLVRFIQRSDSLPLRKSGSMDFMNADNHVIPVFILVIQTGTTKKVLLSTKYEYDYITNYSLKYIERLVHSSGLKRTNISLNEDSILAPLLTTPEFSSILPTH